MNPYEKLPPWRQPMQYNDPADNPPPTFVEDDEPFERRGPHQEDLDVDDDDLPDDEEE